MLNRLKPLFVGAALCLGALGCDGAKSDYEICLQLKEAGEIDKAIETCSAAVQKAPQSASGQAAQKLLGEMQQARVGELSKLTLDNLACARAQLDLAGAEPQDVARLTSVRDEKCKDTPKQAPATP